VGSAVEAAPKSVWRMGTKRPDLQLAQHPRASGEGAVVSMEQQHRSDGDHGAQQHASDNLQAVRDEALSFAERQKRAGAEHIGEVAHAVHTAADAIRTEMPTAADYVHRAAAGLENAAQALKQRGLDDLGRDLGSFARTQPLAMFGGAMLAGFVLSRFLKSTAADGQTSRYG